jgi:hypothetical protein
MLQLHLGQSFPYCSYCHCCPAAAAATGYLPFLSPGATLLCVLRIQLTVTPFNLQVAAVVLEELLKASQQEGSSFEASDVCSCWRLARALGQH